MKTSPYIQFLLLLIANTVTGYVCPDGRNVQCDRVCLLIYQPVCGTDWRTYSNVCALETARDCCGLPIRVWHMGPCQYPFMPIPPPVPHRFFPFLPYFMHPPSLLGQNQVPPQQPSNPQNEIPPQVFATSRPATEEAKVNGPTNTAAVPAIGTVVSSSSTVSAPAVPSQQLQVETDETNELEPMQAE